MFFPRCSGEVAQRTKCQELRYPDGMECRVMGRRGTSARDSVPPLVWIGHRKKIRIHDLLKRPLRGGRDRLPFAALKADVSGGFSARVRIDLFRKLLKLA